MGLDLLVDPLFAQTVAEASAATGLDITTILRSEHGELDQTANVQPALVTVSYGLTECCAGTYQLPVAGMVGLSLGEYAALLAARQSRPQTVLSCWLTVAVTCRPTLMPS